jgi:hypothetical protein
VVVERPAGVRSRISLPLRTPSSRRLPQLTAVSRPPAELAKLTPRGVACIVLRYYEDLGSTISPGGSASPPGAVKRYLGDSLAQMAVASPTDAPQHPP